MGALFRLLLLSWEIVVVINDVSAGCDRVKGPTGNTDCVYSFLNGLFQAAVCMPRKEIEMFSSKHFSCRGGRGTKYCWYLCTATAGHGGLSACECDPDVQTSRKSEVPLACYFPTGRCSWFTECLGKRVNCSSTIKAATERCNSLDTASQSVSKNGQEWVNATKKCTQNNMIHYLYPQINFECNNMREIMESSDKLCYREKLYESQFCKLTFSDVVTIHGYLSAFYRNFLLCKITTALPPWSKLVIFYVKNFPDQNLDEIAGQFGNTLSKKYEWSKVGLDHIAASPARLAVKGQTVPIRVYIYSKTQSSENISEVISEKIKELKMDIADGKMSSLSLAKVGNVNITQVVGCKDPQCLSSTFSMLTGNDAPCTDIGGTCQDDSLPCSGGYESGLCGGGVNRRCCKEEDESCVSIGGTCQNDSLSCSGGYESGLCGGGVNRRCCKEEDESCVSIGGTCQNDSLLCSGGYESGLCGGGVNRRCCKGGTCSGVKIYSRTSWGAKAPKSSTRMSTNASLFFVHHTAGSSCKDFTSCAAVMLNTQKYHMETKGWSDIGYSFLVGEDGAVYEGRGWNKVGAHTKGYNSRGLAASVMGNFMNRKPNAAALNAIKNLIQCGISRGYITSTYKLYGHRDVGSTSCPGDALYQEIKTWPRYSTQKP